MKGDDGLELKTHSVKIAYFFPNSNSKFIKIRKKGIITYLFFKFYILPLTYSRLRERVLSISVYLFKDFFFFTYLPVYFSK